MGVELVFANILKAFFLVTSPVTFLVGIFLLFDVNTYMRIEKFLGRDITVGAPKKKLITEINKHREMLQMFLLKWRRIIGIICLCNSTVAIIFTIYVLFRNY